MPNAKDFTGDLRRVLNVGSGGCGKTTMVRTLPGRKFAYLFDPNALQSLKGCDIDYEEFIREPNLAVGTGKKPEREKTPSPAPFLDFVDHFQSNDTLLDEYDWIIMDSATTLIGIAEDYVCDLAGVPYIVPFSVEKDKGNLYVDVQVQVLNVFASLCRMKKNVYITAHTQFKQEGDSGPFKNLLMFIGQHQAKLPLLFTDIWRSFAEPDKEKKGHWYIQTVPDKYSEYVRTTMHNLEGEEEVTITDWDHPEESGFGLLLKYHRGEIAPSSEGEK